MLLDSDVQAICENVEHELRLRWECLDAALPLDWPHEWSPRENFCDGGPGGADWLRGWIAALVPPRNRALVLSWRRIGPWKSGGVSLRQESVASLNKTDEPDGRLIHKGI